jgi:pyrimidine operon attenuation protein/uracil phosphoribosyltransferase
VKKEILSNLQIKQKTLRIAYQIAEACFEENQITLVGVVPKGQVFASLLAKDIQDILPHITIKIASLTINKEMPLEHPIELSCAPEDLTNEYVILVDDVINSGKTIFYGLKPFMHIPLKKLKTAVLVDRKHKAFPVASDYVGLSLNTTLREHITVDTQNGSLLHAFLI